MAPPKSPPPLPTQVDSAVDDPERLYSKYEAAQARNPILQKDYLLNRDDTSRNDDLSTTKLGTAQPLQDNTEDILRIIPANLEARKAFDTVARLVKKGALHQHHERYLQITGQGPVGQDVKRAPRDSDETTDEAVNDLDLTMVYEGFFRLCFSLPTVHQGSVIGRGSGRRYGPTRNVDILLAAPGCKAASGLSAAHLYLAIYAESGAWLLTAGAEMRVEDETIMPNDMLCLHVPKTRIEIRGMQYLVQFEISTPAMEDAYIKARNEELHNYGIPLPQTSISGIPFRGDIVFDSIVFRHGLSSGSFGTVFEGINPANGKLRVAKRITIRSVYEVPTVRQEIQALERFGGYEGILELIEWRTILNDKQLSVSHYPLDIYLVHDKGVAFDKFDWTATFGDWDLRRSLCYQLLTGLEYIHQAGCMHRDITPMNILVFPRKDTATATLCDFGKFCPHTSDTSTRLAGWNFLPPELVEGGSKPYGQSIDIWMLGLALACSWWPQTKKLRPRQDADYRQMQELLRDERQGDSLGQLIARMMTRDPYSRPSALHALTDKSLQGIAKEEVSGRGSTAKRPFNYVN